MLFEPQEHPLLDVIRGADVDNLTPLAALSLVQQWQQSLATPKSSQPKESSCPSTSSNAICPAPARLTPQQVQAVAEKSCAVLRGLGPQIQWLQSYVTDDKIYCIYIAPDKRQIEEHARQGGFPADRISEVRSVIDPTSAEAKS